MKARRIGIYAGTFDPVHAGHVAFALQAVQQGQLDILYFLPERRPRRKTGVEHFGHRVAMLRRAIKPHPQFDILEFPERYFTVGQTLPRLNREFPGDQLILLFGSDIIASLGSWSYSKRLLESAELIIGLRSTDELADVQQQIEKWPGSPTVTLLESFAPEVSSRQIREALRKGQDAAGLLKSVARYSDRNWLYIALDKVDQA